MNIRPIISEILRESPIASLVGGRVALEHLPTVQTNAPSLIYKVISDREEPALNINAPILCVARVEFNAWAPDMRQVEQINRALYNLLNFRHQTTRAGALIVSSRADTVGNARQDDTTGLWTQPVDYLLRYYD